MHSPKLWYVRGLGLDKHSKVVATLAEDGRVERWGHRARVSHREDPGEVHIVLSGALDLRDGAHDVGIRLRPGDVFGETGHESVRGDSGIIAYDDTRLVAVHRSLFDDTARDALGSMTARTKLMRGRTLMVPASMLVYTAPEPRLARVILHLVERYGRVEGDRASLDVAVHSRVLARMSGLAHRAASDIFDSMQRRQFVEVGRNGLWVPSVEGLRAVVTGEEEP